MTALMELPPPAALRALRHAAQLTQADVAVALGTTTTTVSISEGCRALGGRAGVGYALTLGIEAFLLDYLAGESEYQPPPRNNFTRAQFKRWSGSGMPGPQTFDGLPSSPSYVGGVEKLGLSVRTTNLLRRNGIMTLAELTARTDDELRRCTNLGCNTLDEIKECLAQRGHRLASVSDKRAPTFDPYSALLPNGLAHVVDELEEAA